MMNYGLRIGFGNFSVTIQDKIDVLGNKRYLNSFRSGNKLLGQK